MSHSLRSLSRPGSLKELLKRTIEIYDLKFSFNPKFEYETHSSTCSKCASVCFPGGEIIHTPECSLTKEEKKI